MCDGYGIFMWTSHERRSNRYGAFYLATQNYDETVTVKADLHDDLNALVGKRVKVSCRVLANRVSGHVGDLFLNIFPTTPELGEIVELGVATLALEPTDGGEMQIVMVPNDQREELWIDPRLLYHLHDQTVGLYVRETDEPFSPVPVLDERAPDGAKIVGAGTFQTKRTPLPQDVLVEPVITPLGDGLFEVSFGEQGDDIIFGREGMAASIPDH
jgi:hypothetical protein